MMRVYQTESFLFLKHFRFRKELTLKEVAEIVGIKTIQPLIKSLIEKKCAIVSEELNHKYSPKFATFLSIDDRIQSEEQLSDILNELENNKRNEKAGKCSVKSC
jgi:primosomal protein N' (replication factor Y)